jgi:hypothetical protein
VAGRQPKLAGEREQRLLDALRAGNSIQHACKYAGVSDETYRRRTLKDVAFVEATKKAQMEAVVRNDVIQTTTAAAIVSK